jgi:hypothetical protein
MSIGLLVSKQNPDGGWPYVRGASWTEPTVYAILALLSASEIEPARRGLRWILGIERSGGGWPPQAGVEQSTWVTALVALLPPDLLGQQPHNRAIQWLLGTTGKESTPVYRLREWLIGNPVTPEQEFPGWPWVPGSAAWVGPTSVAVLALDKEYRRNPTTAVGLRMEEGRKYLLRRMCREGGWNHGSVRALGYESRPYPETTGMALAALRGVHAPEIPLALDTARRFLAECRSADALNWLQLGLLAHGQLPPGYCRPVEVESRTLTETSLQMLVSASGAGRETLLG